MRIKLAIPDRLLTPEVMEAALEATSLANEQAIKHGEVPPLSEAISRGVRWRPEPFTDGEHFDLAEQVMGRKWGDCDDLAPWLAGELRATGDDPGAVPRVYQSGPNRWHVVVQTSDGKIHDPSKWAGMDQYKRTHPGVSGSVGAALARPIARPGQGALAVIPHNGHYYCRCDIPWPQTLAHLASHARGRTPDQAVARAINGALACGEVIGADLDQAEECGILMCGDDDSIEEIGFLPALAALAPAGISLAKGLFSKKKKRAPPTAVQHPSGAVSVPIKRSKHSKRGGKSNRMFLSYFPQNAQGPVVMRF